jgi:hypothetical protein
MTSTSAMSVVRLRTPAGAGQASSVVLLFLPGEDPFSCVASGRWPP